jgi:hypothetical protein
VSYQIRLKRAPSSRLSPPVGYVEWSKKTRIIRIWYYHLSTCPARPAFLPISTPDPEKSHAKKPKTGADLAIAAIAIARGGIVVTGDVGDFLAIHPAFPLPGLYDPFADAWQVRPARGRR